MGLLTSSPTRHRAARSTGNNRKFAAAEATADGVAPHGGSGAPIRYAITDLKSGKDNALRAITSTRRLSIYLATAAAAATVLTGAAPASAAGTVVNISPQNASQTAIAKSSPSASFSLAVLQNDGPFANQRWTMQQVANLGGNRLAFTFTSASGGCLDVNGASLKSGEALVVKTCNGSLSQQWIRDFSVNATFLKLQNRNSGLVATADGAGSGARITQRADFGGLSQRWSIFGAL